MDPTTLVTAHERFGDRLARHLEGDTTFGLTAAFWWFDPDTERWSLVLASRLYKAKGPRAAYTAIEKALRELSSRRAQGHGLRLSEVSAVSSSDPRVAAMATAMQVDGGRGRVQGSTLNGIYVHDAVVYRLGIDASDVTDGDSTETAEHVTVAT